MKYIDDKNLENSSFENKYDLKIYNWTINELPIYLSEYEKNEMKELYGNRVFTSTISFVFLKSSNNNCFLNKLFSFNSFFIYFPLISKSNNFTIIFQKF